MREIESEEIAQAVRQLFLEACLCPPKEVMEAIANAAETEPSEQGREVLRQLEENGKIALKEQIPYCQDTGMAVVFAEIGQEVHIAGDFYEAVNRGVREAYQEGYFRKSVLTALERKNTGDNTPAVVHVRLTPGDRVRLVAAPKGFGSENMSAIAMLKPSQGIEGIEDFIVDTARRAGGNPCPPVVLGVGIGGTFELAALMAKEQLLRPIGAPSEDPVLAELEQRVKERINGLGMGPMGIGGRNYCLAVHAKEHPTHLAGLPVAVNYCCHALRHSETTI